MHLRNFDNQQLGLTNIVNTCLKKILTWMVDLNDRFKNLADIDDKVNIVVGTPYPIKKKPIKKTNKPHQKKSC